MVPAAPLRVASTLLLAWGAALACEALHTPIPWMIGPLLGTALASLAGAPTQSWLPLRNAAQWLIGTALGLYFTPQVARLVGGLWWAVLLAVAWALLLGWLAGRWLHHAYGSRMDLGPREQRATCWFAGAIGGASEMTLLAERAGGRMDLVAAAHALRLVIVTLAIPFAFAASGLHGLDPSLPGPRHVDGAGLAVLGLVTVAGGWLMARTGRANPWFMGALLSSMALTLAGIELSAMPVAFTNAAQLVIGAGLGVLFQARFLRAAPLWLGAVALSTVCMLVLCAGFALLLSRATGLHPATLVLGTSPGGIAEMAITAKVLQLGVPVVTAFQVCRLVAVLVLVEPLFGWTQRKGRDGNAGPPANGSA